MITFTDWRDRPGSRWKQDFDIKADDLFEFILLQFSP